MFPARRYASAVYAVIVRLCVIQVYTETAKRRITQATPHDTQGLWFSDAEDFGKIQILCVFFLVKCYRSFSDCTVVILLYNDKQAWSQYKHSLTFHVRAMLS